MFYACIHTRSSDAELPRQMVLDEWSVDLDIEAYSFDRSSLGLHQLGTGSTGALRK